MRGRSALFAAFDLVWLDGEDLREQPLHRRKTMLRKLIRKSARRTFFVDHVMGAGKPFYRQICDLDMEGIVCKPVMSPYRPLRGETTWIKVKNPNYSQAKGRHELLTNVEVSSTGFPRRHYIRLMIGNSLRLNWRTSRIVSLAESTDCL